MHKKVFTLYISVFFLLPLILFAIIGLHSNFKIGLIDEKYIIYIAIIILNFILISYYLDRLNFLRYIKLPNIFIFDLYWFVLLLISLVIGVIFFIHYDITYRQTGVNLSESGVIAQLVYLIKPLVISYSFYHFFTCKSITKIVKINLFIVLLFIVLTIFSSFEALLIFTLFLFILCPRLFDFIFYSKNTTIIKKIFTSSLLIIISLLSVFCIIFIGISNKVGFIEGLNYFRSEELLSKLSYYLYYRISIFHTSLILHLDRDWLDLSLISKSLNIIYDGLMYRISILIGDPISRPTLTNLNRLNYEFIFTNPSLKEIGASPGLPGSFLMFFPIPIAGSLCGIYLGMLFNILCRISKKLEKKNYSYFASFLILYYLFPFLHNPFHSFLTIGPESYKFFLYLLTLITLSRSNNHKSFIRRV